MALVPAHVAGQMPTQESIVNVLAVPGSVALASTALCLCAGLACAQSAAPASTQTGQPVTPLQLQVPTRPVEAAAPANTSDNATVDAQDSAADDSRHGPQVHGSFTAGIGYSSGYGTSTMQAADFDISGQSDSGNTYDMRIHLMQSKGLGFGPHGSYYGSRVRGD